MLRQTSSVDQCNSEKNKPQKRCLSSSSAVEEEQTKRFARAGTSFLKPIKSAERIGIEGPSAEGDQLEAAYREASPVVISDWLQTFKVMPKEIQSDALKELVKLCSVQQVKYLQTVIDPHFKRDFISCLPKERTVDPKGTLRYNCKASSTASFHSGYKPLLIHKSADVGAPQLNKCLGDISNDIQSTLDLTYGQGTGSCRTLNRASTISLKILSYLSPKDLVRGALLCKCWKQLMEDSVLWLNKCKHYSVPHIFPPSLNRQENWKICGTQDHKSGDENHRFEMMPDCPVYHGSDQPCTSSSLTKPHIISDIYLSDVPINSESSCYVRSKWKAIYLRNERIKNNWCKRRLTASCQLRGHDDHVITCVQLHQDTLVTGSDDNTIRVWSSATAQCLHVLVGHQGGVWSLQLSEDGKTLISGSTDSLVSGSRDSTLRVWNIKEGHCLHTLYGHIAAVRCVQFDGHNIISGGYDNRIIVWDVNKGLQTVVLEGHTNRVYALLYESERHLIISGSLDTTIKVWNLKTGECLQTLVGHQSLTSGMQLRGDLLVSANADSTIKVWNIVDGQCLHTLAGQNRHSSAVTSLQFLQNGLVATSGDDGFVKLWDVEKGAFICDLVKLGSSGAGGCVWRLKATSTMLVCAVGSRNGTEDTKLIMMDFDSPYP